MSRTTTDSEDEDKPISIVRASDTDKSKSQVDQLLAISAQAERLLINGGSDYEKADIDETAAKAALKTYELVQIRIRDLIDEQPRWSLAPTPAEQEASRVMAGAATLAEQKTINMKLYNRPSIFLRPKIRKFSIGWIAWIGEGLPDHNSLHGVGPTPALANDAFDQHYYGLQEETKKRETSPLPPAPASKPPRKKSRKTKS